MPTIERKKEMLFPHEEIRKYQEELINDIEKTLLSKGRLIADAPTGLGKTVSALGPALNQALKTDLTVWFLTNRHTQHQLAIETLKLIQKKYNLEFNSVDLIGKKGMCNQEVKGLFTQEFNEFCRTLTEKGECEFLNKVKSNNKLTIEAKQIIEQLNKKGVIHYQELLDICQSKNMCAYEIALELGKKAKVIIGDYYYVFNPFIQKRIFSRMNQELEKSILIIDEAHNLPKRAVEMLSTSLTNFMVKNAVLEAKKNQQEAIIPWLEKINNTLNELNKFDKKIETERIVTKTEFIDLINQIKNYPELIEELETISEEIRKINRRSYIGGIANFLSCWLGEDQGFSRIIVEKESKFGKIISLNYYCLDPSLVTSHIFEKVNSTILMSGTLKPTFMYNDILGVKGKEKEYFSPFPIENKLTLIIPETTTKYNSRGEKMYQQIGEKCTEILKLIPGNCAIFFPSYYLRDVISPKIESEKKKFWEKSEMSTENRELFLTEFKEEKKKGGILLGVMGGSFSEGIDLPGDLLKGVIVVGVPLSQPDLKTKETITYFTKKYGKGWEYGYLYPAMNKCFQSSGRCIRSETDKGVVIYLDERFSWPNYFCCFPKEGLIVTKNFQPYLSSFFERQNN